jgi:hypothetical protein
MLWNLISIAQKQSAQSLLWSYYRVHNKSVYTFINDRTYSCILRSYYISSLVNNDLRSHISRKDDKT